MSEIGRQYAAKKREAAQKLLNNKEVTLEILENEASPQETVYGAYHFNSALEMLSNLVGYNDNTVVSEETPASSKTPIERFASEFPGLDVSGDTNDLVNADQSFDSV